MGTTERNSNTDGLLAWDKFLSEAGLSLTTGWRWRKAGMVVTLNISGRVYVRRSELARFLEAAERGDFAKEHPARLRNRKEASK